MQLLHRLRNQSTQTRIEAGEIQDRVEAMRRQMGERDMALADLFALLGEDERPVLRAVEGRPPESPRLWPHQVP